MSRLRTATTSISPGPLIAGEGLHNEPEQTVEEATNEAWRRKNLLTFDGGGIRGYWSLLALNKLMGYIAQCEEEYGKGTASVEPHWHSFQPEQLPANHTHVLTPDEVRERDRAEADEKDGKIDKEKRFLPCHYFDIIGGSSTGGLIAIMLGRLRMTVPDCLHEYKTLGTDVFGKPRPFGVLGSAIGVSGWTKYDATNLEGVFREVSAKRGEQSEDASPPTIQTKSKLCKVFVVALKTGKNRSSATPYLIRSYRCVQRVSPQRMRTNTSVQTMRRGTWVSGDTTEHHTGQPAARINLGEAHNFEIWQVARAATAAHHFFAPIKIDNYASSTKEDQRDLFFEDGGLFAINPTRYGVEEIDRREGRGRVGIVVSLGTARDKTLHEASAGKLGKGIKQDYNIMSDPDDVDHQVRGLATNSLHRFNYLRINPSHHRFHLKVELDEWLPRRKSKSEASGSRTIAKMEDAFKDWWSSDDGIAVDFKTLAEHLVECRRRRAQDRRLWERYAIATEYACNVDDPNGCHNPDRKWTNLHEFMDHLTHDHRLNGRSLDNAKRNALCSRWHYKSKPA